MKRLLAGLLSAWLSFAPAYAANLTPDQLTQAITANNTDLLLIYPSGGPLKSVQWSVVKSLMQTALGSVYLQATNNLNDVSSASTSRTNLGLGTAATYNVGTSGTVLGALNAGNTWSGTQTWLTGTLTSAPMRFIAGTNLTTPLSGAVEWDGSNLYITKASGPTRETLLYADGSNLPANSITAADIVQIGANTVIGNNTNATANFTTLSMPSCSAGTSALIWTTNTGFGCNTITPGSGTVTSIIAGTGLTGGTITTTGTIAVSYGTAANTAAQGNDSRFGGPTQNSQSTAYGLALTDAGKQLYHPSADTTARTWTIPANGSVAFAVGTKIDVVNDCSAGVLTIAITTDTLVWFPAGTTGSRSLAACGEATLSKVTSTRWVITGAGLT